MAFPVYLVLSSDGFQEEPNQNVFRTDVEQGPPKQGVKGSRSLVFRNVTYMAITKADYLSFVTWFRTTIHWGADWFDWTDPVDGVTKKASIKDGKYTAKPWTPTLSRWDITFVIETWAS